MKMIISKLSYYAGYFNLRLLKSAHYYDEECVQEMFDGSDLSQLLP